MRVFGATLVGSLITLVGCSGSPSPGTSEPTPVQAPTQEPVQAPNPTATTDYTPSDSWESAEASGWDAARLDELVAYAGSKGSKTFVLLAGGRLLRESYFVGADATFTDDVFSVQKSVTAVVAGIAIDKGLLALEETATSILGAGWSNASDEVAEAKITVRHLLTMSSGLDLDLGYSAPAGSAWLYNDEAFYRVRLVIEKRTGKELDAVAREWLFDPIGMKNSKFQRRLAKDSKGLPVVGLQTSSRDLARFGLLMERRGTWAGSSIVSPSYVDEAAATSQVMNESYGFLFWLNGKSGGLLPPSTAFTGVLVPSAPADAFAALGKGDQKVWIARSLELVLVRQGDPAGESKNALSSFDEELWKRVIAAKK